MGGAHPYAQLHLYIHSTPLSSSSSCPALCALTALRVGNSAETFCTISFRFATHLQLLRNEITVASVSWFPTARVRHIDAYLSLKFPRLLRIGTSPTADA